ncbi:UNVERIFIED_CONTAM: YusW family protein [Halobacillus marinus]|uniref:YusW family protein n=1 Tax=Bacillaceae TaxID=186817 RepID=UPI0002A51371|nr:MULTISPECIES: YusW family protein [Bacillaceae]ELK47766.1 putative lipoprotein [Halobacillus sp. BAB-2008]QHT45451.1 hypothetical protein M662_02625 [Bacillus sp. SB49]
MMNNWKTLSLLAAVPFFLLAGCNDNDEVSNPPEDAPQEEQAENGAAETDEQSFPFTSFDLEVHYPENNTFDVDYEKEKDGMEASYQDDMDDQNLQSDEALAQMTPLFQELTFDKDTADDEVIKQVKEAFNLPDDYESFELDVDFPDGTEKEYRDQTK